MGSSGELTRLSELWWHHFLSFGNLATNSFWVLHKLSLTRTIFDLSLGCSKITNFFCVFLTFPLLWTLSLILLHILSFMFAYFPLFLREILWVLSHHFSACCVSSFSTICLALIPLTTSFWIFLHFSIFIFLFFLFFTFTFSSFSLLFLLFLPTIYNMYKSTFFTVATEG